jgi:hypothetical protein
MFTRETRRPADLHAAGVPAQIGVQRLLFGDLPGLLAQAASWGRWR